MPLGNPFRQRARSRKSSGGAEWVRWWGGVQELHYCRDKNEETKRPAGGWEGEWGERRAANARTPGMTYWSTPTGSFSPPAPPPRVLQAPTSQRQVAVLAGAQSVLSVCCVEHRRPPPAFAAARAKLLLLRLFFHLMWEKWVNSQIAPRPRHSAN